MTRSNLAAADWQDGFRVDREDSRPHGNTRKRELPPCLLRIEIGRIQIRLSVDLDDHSRCYDSAF